MLYQLLVAVSGLKINGHVGGKVKRENLHSFLINSMMSFIIVITFFLLSFSTANAQIVVNSAWIQDNLREGALVLDQAAATYKFETDFRADGTAVFVYADNVTIDLNGHTITFGAANRNGTIGVNPFKYRTAWTLGSDDQSFSFTNQEGSGGNNLVIKNGRIIWGGKSGTWATAVGGTYSGNNITIENMYLETGGNDGACVQFNWTNITVHDSYCINNSNGTENRHQGPGNIKSEGKVVAYNNIVIGGNSAIVAGSNSIIYNNVLRHSGFATNGYGVWLSTKDHVEAYNNVIVPSNGRGVLFNAGTYQVAHDNLICVHEEPNAEFGADLNPPAIRIRYNANHNEFYNNKCVAVGGGNNTSGSGAYLTVDGGMENKIYNNVFKAILTSSPTQTQYANAITFEGQGSDAAFGTDVVDNNEFGSNNYLVRLTGYDGGSHQNSISNNTLEWVNGDDTYNWFASALDDSKYNFQYSSSNTYVTSALLQQIKDEVKTELRGLIGGQPDNRNRYTFYTGFDVYDGYITMAGTKLTTGVGMEPSDVFVLHAGAGINNIQIAHFLYVVARDKNGTLISGKSIVVSDNSGSTYNGITDASGKTRLELVDYAMRKNSGESSVNRESRDHHQATIAGIGAVDLPLSIQNDASNPYILNFSGVFDPSDAAPAKPANPRVEP